MTDLTKKKREKLQADVNVRSGCLQRHNSVLQLIKEAEDLLDKIKGTVRRDFNFVF
jgi:hypothetical protein